MGSNKTFIEANETSLAQDAIGYLGGTCQFRKSGLGWVDFSGKILAHLMQKYLNIKE